MPEGGATYYAHHSAKQYKVYFNGNGASVSTSYMSVTYDSTYGNLPTPSRTGYTFIGWFNYSYKDAPLKYYADMYTDLKNAFGYDQYRLWNHYTNYGAREGRRVSQYLGSDTVKITSDITVYAGWLANQYTVSYDRNGGAGSRNTDTVTYNTSYTTPSNPFSRTGYTFAGWNERADGTGTDWTNWIGRGWTWTYTNSITLYAQWSKNPYKIYYQAGNGNGNTVYEQYYYDSWYQIRNHGNGFSKTGYSFAGWYASDGTNVTGWSGTYGWTGDLWLTAHWTANTYKVTYNAGGGNGSAEQWVTYDSYYALKSDGSGFWRTYYDFSYWKSSADGGNWTGWSGTWQYAGNVTLTAQWSLHTYHVYYTAGAGQGNRQESTYRYGDWFQIKGDGSGFWKDGHHFSWWRADDDGSNWTGRSGQWTRNGDLWLSAQWDINVYTVYLYGNGKTNDTIINVRYGDSTGNLPDPWNSEYQCNGWSTSSSATGGSWKIDNVTGDIRLWATWYHKNQTGLSGWNQVGSWNAGWTELVRYNFGESRKVTYIGGRIYGGVYSMWADRTFDVLLQVDTGNENWINIGSTGESQEFKWNGGQTREQSGWVGQTINRYCNKFRVLVNPSTSGKRSDWLPFRGGTDGNLYGGYENLQIQYAPN